MFTLTSVLGYLQKLFTTEVALKENKDFIVKSGCIHFKSVLPKYSKVTCLYPYLPEGGDREYSVKVLCRLYRLYHLIFLCKTKFGFITENSNKDNEFFV